jgi:protein-S-isoprenylcysteine O-methyltransferase Ste14
MARRLYFTPSRFTMGVGPLLVTLTLVFIVLVVAVDRAAPGLRITALHNSVLRLVSLTLLIASAVLYVRTITTVREAAAAGRLVTDGPFRYVRHPIYAVYIFLVCPAIVIAVASWPGLTIPCVAYGLYRLLIGREEARLEASFGDEYRVYRRRVGGIVPRRRAVDDRPASGVRAA